MSLCVDPPVHQAPDRHRPQAQDVGHSQDVFVELCHVCGREQSKSSCRAALLVARSVSSGTECSSCYLRTSRGTSVGLQPSTAACTTAALSSTGPTCRGTSRARRGRPGLCGVFAVRLLGSSSTSAAAGVNSAGMGDLLMCERSGDGVCWLPPVRPL